MIFRWVKHRKQIIGLYGICDLFSDITLIKLVRL